MTHIVVALGSHANEGVLLNAAARRAKELGVPWHVVYVQTPTHSLRGDEHQQMILRWFTTAEEKGAITHRVEAKQVIYGLLDYLKSYDKKSVELFMGKPVAGLSTAFFQRPLSVRLFPHLPASVSIRAIPLSGRATSDLRADILRIRSVKPRHILYALLSVLIAFIATELLRATMSVAEFSASSYNTNIIFVLPPIIISLRFGLVAGLVAALTGFFTLNYFYIHPIHKLDVVDYQGIINAGLFVSTAVIMALLGSYSHAYADSIRRRERRTQALFAINEVASQSRSRQEALVNIHQKITHLMEMQAIILLPSSLNPNTIEAAYPQQPDLLTEAEWEAAHDSWEQVHTNGFGSPRFTRCVWRFEPMITGQDRFGVLGIKIPPKADIDATFGQLLAALADQVGIALHRIELSRELEDKRISEERERLRAMLLSSVSHDLKTPLASIIGSLSVYHGMFHTLPEKQKRELTETALDEAQRLDSFITNILDMTRIESGQVQFRREWSDPYAIVRRVCKRLQVRLQHNPLYITPPEAPCEVEADEMMTEQVLQNILDNATKYTPQGTEIHIYFEARPEGMCLIVRDTGRGIPTDKLESIFDKYERIRQRDQKIAGTGLGLAIARAVMEAQSGKITADNHIDGGAMFTLVFSSYRYQSTPLLEAVS